MHHIRLTAALTLCCLALAACGASATSVAPFDREQRAPAAGSGANTKKELKTKTKKSAGERSTTSKKSRSSQGGEGSDYVWTGSCEPQGTCSRTDRTCDAEGTLCVFKDGGPEGECLTIEQRKNCR